MTMQNSASLSAPHRVRAIAFLLAISLVLGGSSAPRAAANELPTAAGSPIAGIAFDDRPLILPVQRNFQMAMLTASSELSRSCGRMEAYGWRMSETEQTRVNAIFDNSVDRLRAQGFSVEAKNASTVSRDVTLYTADRADKHLLFMWSAGEVGLVLVMCETSAPNAPMSLDKASIKADEAMSAPAPTSLQPTNSKGYAAPTRLSKTGKPVDENFSPMGDWVGDYTCSQGTTGATLHIETLKGDQFEGTFHFYPTAKNPYVSRGKYRVFGEYDRDSLRILVNPGKWIERPKDFFNTIMIGSFDPVAQSFSGFFQGITGCTSFEAKMGAAVKAASVPAAKPAQNTVKPKAKTAKKAVKKAAAKTKTAPAKAAEEAVAPKSDAALPVASDAPAPARNSAMDPLPEPAPSPAGIEIPKP